LGVIGWVVVPLCGQRLPRPPVVLTVRRRLHPACAAHLARIRRQPGVVARAPAVAPGPPLRGHGARRCRTGGEGTAGAGRRRVRHLAGARTGTA